MIEDCRVTAGSMLDNGHPLAEVIQYLRDRELSIVMSISVLAKHTGKSIGEMKQIVASHPAWIDLTRRTDSAHEAAIDELTATEGDE